MVSNTLLFIFGLLLTLFLQSTSFPVTLPSGGAKLRPGMLPTWKPGILKPFDWGFGGTKENWDFPSSIHTRLGSFNNNQKQLLDATNATTTDDQKSGQQKDTTSPKITKSTLFRLEIPLFAMTYKITVK